MNNNIFKDILASNLSDDAKTELLKPIKSGYGLFFSRINQNDHHKPLIKLNNYINKNFSIPHVAIEGENLLALKSLNNKYNGEFVDFIYIDPPYNTRTKLSYEDNRMHSSWLEMMEERLTIAKKIMKPSAFIAISIDDNELYQLKLLMDMIFGENNFVHNLIWRKKTGGGQDSNFLANEHEYILVYSKNINEASTNKKYSDRKIEEFPKIINGKKAQLMKLEKWGIGSRKQDAPSLHYPITDPNGKEYWPIAPDGTAGRWRKKPETLAKECIFWQESKGILTPYEVKYFESANKKKIVSRSILYDIAENTHGTKELTDIFKTKGVFDYPKPTKLIEFLISEFVSVPNAIILDFFAGSGTTIQAVDQYNKKNNTNIRAIIVTRNEQDNNIFDNVTTKRAIFSSEKFGSSIAFMSVKNDNSEFAEDYEFNLLKSISSHLILKNGAIKSDVENVLYDSSNSYVIFEKIEKDPHKLVVDFIIENNKMHGKNVTFLFRNEQPIEQKTISYIAENGCFIMRIPSDFTPRDIIF